MLTDFGTIHLYIKYEIPQAFEETSKPSSIARGLHEVLGQYFICLRKLIFNFLVVYKV